MKAWVLAGPVLASCFSASPARGGPCDFVQAEAGAPNRVPIGPAALGTIPEACRANEASLQTYAALLVATDDFYGFVHVGVAPRLRFALPGGPWLSAWLPGFSYWFSANATVEADLVQLDTGALGVHVPLRWSERTQLAPYARVLVPTSSGYENATRYGFDHGVSAVVRLAANLELTGGFSFPALLTSNGTSLHATLTPGVAGDLVWAPWAWFGIVGGLGARFRAGPQGGFAAFDWRMALRAYALRGLRFELGTVVPSFGSDRTDALLQFSVGWVQAANDP